MTETAAQYVKIGIEDRVATVTLDHPPVNALNKQMLQELGAAMDQLAGDASVKVIVLTAAGQLAWVAGADIGEIASVKSPEEAQAFILLGQQTYSKIENMRKPVIAAITGLALGGGLELAMSCHMRIAGDRVQLGQPEINLGIIPGWGGTQRLTRIVGPAKAAEIILTGKNITAQEAARLNLVNKVVPGGEVLKTARDLARVIADKSALAIAAALEAIGGGWRGDLEAGLAGELAAFQWVAKGDDWREGVSAFLEKRRPQFKDK
jgi:enoyl-CoA hydratase/carnithine racemase